MGHGRKRFSNFREPAKKGPPLGLVISLAAAGGVIVGSTGTYFLARPSVAPNPSASPAPGGTPQAQTITMPQAQFTPAPQPPGEPPPGKVWSVEHGHWHDAPVALTIPGPGLTPPAPEAAPAPAAVTVTPAAPSTPAPAAVPAEKKE